MELFVAKLLNVLNSTVCTHIILRERSSYLRSSKGKKCSFNLSDPFFGLRNDERKARKCRRGANGGEFPYYYKHIYGRNRGFRKKKKLNQRV